MSSTQRTGTFLIDVDPNSDEHCIEMILNKGRY